MEQSFILSAKFWLSSGPPECFTFSYFPMFHSVTNHWQIIILILCISSSLFSCKECEQHPASSLSFSLPSTCPKALLKPWPNGLASQRKFAKPELAYGLTKGWQTDSQVGSQVHASSKRPQIHAFTDDLRSLCVDLLWVAKQLKTCVDLRANFRPIKVNAKTMQVGG